MENWEKKFDEEFSLRSASVGGSLLQDWDVYEDIKSFIRNNRKELLEEIKQEIAEYSSLNAEQTKDLIEIINNYVSI